MRQQLEALEEELTAIEAQLTDPETAKDSGRLQALMRRYGELAPLKVRTANAMKRWLRNITPSYTACPPMVKGI